MDEEQKPATADPMIKLMIADRKKSIGAAVLLAFFFGPFGLLYVSPMSGIFAMASMIWQLDEILAE